MKVDSTTSFRLDNIKALTEAQIMALEMTAEALHTEVVQAQVMPFQLGNLQNESTFVDTSNSQYGKVSLVTTTPYARRLYYHPEYQFKKTENANAGGEWYKDFMPNGRKGDFCTNAYKEMLQRIVGG